MCNFRGRGGNVRVASPLRNSARKKGQNCRNCVERQLPRLHRSEFDLFAPAVRLSTSSTLKPAFPRPNKGAGDSCNHGSGSAYRVSVLAKRSRLDNGAGNKDCSVRRYASVFSMTTANRSDTSRRRSRAALRVRVIGEVTYVMTEATSKIAVTVSGTRRLATTSSIVANDRTSRRFMGDGFQAAARTEGKAKQREARRTK